jgi:hypothetical protein
MGRNISSCSCGAHGYDDLRLLIDIDIGEQDLFDRSIATSNKACSEKAVSSSGGAAS